MQVWLIVSLGEQQLLPIIARLKQARLGFYPNDTVVGADCLRHRSQEASLNRLIAKCW